MTSAKLVRAILRLALIALVMLLPTTSQSQDRRNFWLLNSTGKTISEFYVSPHESDNWGQDILGRAELPNGVGTLIVFTPNLQTSCVMDFKLVFNDGTRQIYDQGRNVCVLGAVQFNRRTSIGLSLPQ